MIAPLTAFEIFTVAGMGLYAAAVPGSYYELHFGQDVLFFAKGRENCVGVQYGWFKPLQTIDEVKKSCSQMASRSIRMLYRWKDWWSIAQPWYESIVKLQSMGDKILSKPVETVLGDQLRSYGSSEVLDAMSPLTTLATPPDQKEFEFLDIDLATIYQDGMRTYFLSPYNDTLYGKYIYSQIPFIG